jgi:predicted amidohydrolase YtcJ
MAAALERPPFLTSFLIAGPELTCVPKSRSDEIGREGTGAMRGFGVLDVVFGILMSIASPSVAAAQDILLVNGRIITLDAQSTVARAIAVSDGRIAAVGTDAQMRAVSPPGTREIDLGGRTVIPGLIDSHIHAIRAGLTFSTQVNWIGATSLRDALERIREAAKTTPPGGWIVVPGGWTIQQYSEARRPSQNEIAQAASGHPVYIQMSYVSALLSPMGFEKLGISGDADLPANGRLERDPEGNPTGWVNGDLGTIVALYARLPRATVEQAAEGTARFFRS